MPFLQRIRVALIAALPLAAVPGFGKDPNAGESPKVYLNTHDLRLGLGLMSGQNTYQIGGHFDIPGVGSGNIHFPLSELVWPLDVTMVSLGGRFKPNANWEIQGKFLKNLNTSAGKMKDSDWTSLDDPTLKTVYSESDTKFNGWTADVNASYWLAPPQSVLNLGVGLGYLHQSFDWKGSNTVQESIDPGVPNVSLPGVLAITYKSTLSMPYAELSGRLIADRFSLNAAVGVSPSATFRDEDDHVLRYKLSKIKASGPAVKLAFQARYDFDALFAFAQLDTLSYEIDGTQTQTDYSGSGGYLTIDAKAKGSQRLLTAGVGMRF